MEVLSDLRTEPWNNFQKIQIFENRQFIELSDKFIFKLINYISVFIYDF